MTGQPTVHPPGTAESRVLREVADSIGMNAPHLADMLNAYADGDIRVGVYIERHNAWIREEADRART